MHAMAASPTLNVPACDADEARAAAGTAAEVYARHADFVWASLSRLGVAHDDLPDQLQEVFLVVHRRLADFEGRSAITTWLYGIARRVASDYRRRRPLGTGPLATVIEVADRGPAPSETLARREAARTVMEILEAMEPDKREVFALMELEQLSAPAVAEMIGVPLNTVYSRLRLARARFEQALARLAATELREVTP